MSAADSLPPQLDWGIAAQTLEGESVSGDTAVVVPANGTTLIAVIDGLGHGPEAASAASIAAQALRERAGDSLIRLVEHTHEALKRTRGVAMSLASFPADHDSMTWLGVGNVEGRLVHRQVRGHSMMLAGGVAGLELPRLREATQSISKGSILILATDGVRSDFADSFDWSGSPQEIADNILQKHYRGTDDALVLVARYLGDKA